MASSELCQILNNANANLYPSDPQPNLLNMTVRAPQLSELTFNNNNINTTGKSSSTHTSRCQPRPDAPLSPIPAV